MADSIDMELAELLSFARLDVKMNLSNNSRWRPVLHRMLVLSLTIFGLFEQ